MSLINPIRLGQQISFTVDIGLGPNVGVSFVSSSPSLLGVDSSGIVTAKTDPSSIATAFVSVYDAYNFCRTTIQFNVVPLALDLSGYDVTVNTTINNPQPITFSGASLSVTPSISPRGWNVTWSGLSLSPVSNVTPDSLALVVDPTFQQGTGPLTSGYALQNSQQLFYFENQILPLSSSGTGFVIYDSETNTHDKTMSFGIGLLNSETGEFDFVQALEGQKTLSKTTVNAVRNNDNSITFSWNNLDNATPAYNNGSPITSYDAIRAIIRIVGQPIMYLNLANSLSTSGSVTIPYSNLPTYDGGTPGPLQDPTLINQVNYYIGIQAYNTLTPFPGCPCNQSGTFKL